MADSGQRTPTTVDGPPPVNNSAGASTPSSFETGPETAPAQPVGANNIPATVAGGGGPPPTMTAAQLAAYAPAAFNAFGNTAQVDPTYMDAAQAQAATVNPGTVTGLMYGGQQPPLSSNPQPFASDGSVADASGANGTGNPNGLLNQYTNYLQQALNPEFKLQQQQQEQSDAARGLRSSGAGAYNQSNLQGQQAAAFASQAAPMVSQGFGYAQSDIAANQANAQQVALANAANKQSANAQNATTANSTAAENAAYYNQAQTQNYDAYNSYTQGLLNNAEQTQNAYLTAWLNTLGPNSGVNASFSSAVGGASSAYNQGAANASAPWSALSGLGAAFA